MYVKSEDAKLITKINIPTISNIDTIYHLSDIHIRNLKRHAEYSQVFLNLKRELEKDLKNALIYVAGDIVHAKTDMSPELIDITAKFLRMLGDMAPTIIITGNHDCNLNNKNRLDALKPIIDTLNHPNIYYLRKSGIYNIGNIDFAVMSRLDEMTEWPKQSDCTSKIKIALYHGTVDSAVSDTGFKLSNDKVKMANFNGYTLGLFGDVHKMQIIQDYKYEEMEIDEDNYELYKKKGWLLK